jgi:hypothetical protein
MPPRAVPARAALLALGASLIGACAVAPHFTLYQPVRSEAGKSSATLREMRKFFTPPGVGRPDASEALPAFLTGGAE